MLVKAVATADGARLEVIDEGPGIPDAEAGRVFERFYRSDSARSSRDGGAGLGLAIARWIVELHGGDIRAERREPHGCRMVVHIPGRIEIHEPPAPPTEAPLPELRSEYQRVLVHQRKRVTVSLTTIDDALRRIRRGEMVLVVDDEDRENEGDLTLAAEWVTPEAVNFMLRWARGLVCMPCDGTWLDKLDIEQMVPPGRAGCDTAFTVSIDHRNAGSGIGAADRALTVRRFLHPDSRPDDFIRPGHVFPLRAREGGVLERRGHTEAAVDLARLAGLPPVAVICEVLHDDGSPARVPVPRAVRGGAPHRDDLGGAGCRPPRRATEDVGSSTRPLLL